MTGVLERQMEVRGEAARGRDKIDDLGSAIHRF